MTSPVDTSVKFFSSAMPGAPVLNGTAGAQIGLLDALLVNGFGLKSADSLVVSGGVATIYVSSGHSAIIDSVISVAGSTPSELNGEQRVISTTTNSVSFATSLPNQTATGSITFKIAPVGYTKAFVGTNLAAYKQINPQSSGMYFRVDDTSARFSRVVGYETMTDVNTGVGPFPTTAQSVGGLWWSKSSTADAAARDWFVVADDRTIYVFKRTNPTYSSYYDTSSFGDISSVKNGDAYACFIQGSTSDSSSLYQSDDHMSRFKNGAASGIFMARSYSGLGGSINLIRMCPTINSAVDYYSGDTSSLTTIQYPNLADGGLYVSPILISENINGVYRGPIRGLWGCPQRVVAGNFFAGDIITGIVGMPGKKLRAMTATPVTQTGGLYFIDVLGPWG